MLWPEAIRATMETCVKVGITVQTLMELKRSVELGVLGLKKNQMKRDLI